ncbi:MAG: serine hydrolase [Planctomycetales bacterium]|nr:serine hydrolase [Planctomycetales bacterium]
MHARLVIGHWSLLTGLFLGLALPASVHSQPLPGQLIADADAPHALMRNGGRHVFICGPGDPEGFFYRGERQADGTRKGDQESLVRRLLEYGGNCLYVQAVRSHGGDGAADHNPFVDHDPARGINTAVLDQWETWLSILDDHGVLIYFFLYDDNADPWKTGDTMGADETAFVRSIVNRFEHHRHLVWVVAEESEEALSPSRAAQLANFIGEIDDHQHLIGNHHHSSTKFKSYQPGGPFNHFAMQLNVAIDDVYAQTRMAVDAARGNYSLIYAENTETPQDADHWRRHAWTVAMAGAQPMLLGMDVASTPDAALRQCRILSEFFEDTDFWTMRPDNRSAALPARAPLLLRNTVGAFIAWSAFPSNLLAVDNLQNGETLQNGEYELLWLDCMTGRRVEGATVAVGGRVQLEKPTSIGDEFAVYGSPVEPIALGEQVVFPGKEWERRSAVDLGLDESKLKAFAEQAGGRGCVIKDGYLVYSWGDIGRIGDLASASKPLYSHLLLRAIELNKLESADDLVASYEPCLREINARLGHPDAALTFRHLAFQTASLGYLEPPGGAFDYNDHTMGMFWDVLVNKVLETSWQDAPAIFAREFTEPLEFEDPLEFPVEGRMRGRPRMSPRDFARVGWLYLNAGRWNDRQVLAARHARLASTDPLSLNTPRTLAQEAESCATRSIGGGGNQTDHNGGYSWLWWANEISRDGRRWWFDAPPDMYCALGHCGQRGLAILPSQRLVVSWNDAAELHCQRELGNQAFRNLAAAVPSDTR